MQICRDNFVASLVAKFPDQFEREEIYEILCLFKKPYAMIQGNQLVTDPWRFDRIDGLITQMIMGNSSLKIS